MVKVSFFEGRTMGKETLAMVPGTSAAPAMLSIHRMDANGDCYIDFDCRTKKCIFVEARRRENPLPAMNIRSSGLDLPAGLHDGL